MTSKDVKYAFERAFPRPQDRGGRRGAVEKLGFTITFRTASDAALGTKFCGLPAAKVAICPNFSVTRDCNDPQGLLDPVFNGRNIVASCGTRSRRSRRPTCAASSTATRRAGTSASRR